MKVDLFTFVILVKSLQSAPRRLVRVPQHADTSLPVCPAQHHTQLFILFLIYVFCFLFQLNKMLKNGSKELPCSGLAGEAH